MNFCQPKHMNDENNSTFKKMITSKQFIKYRNLFINYDSLCLRNTAEPQVNPVVNIILRVISLRLFKAEREHVQG